MTNTLFCILLPALLIATFLLEGETYLKIGLSFVIILNYISFIVLRRRIEKMRYFLIVTELVTITMIAVPLILDFEPISLFIVLFIFFTGTLQNLSYLRDKQFFRYSIDWQAHMKSEETEKNPDT
jgi:hypothetical protein